MTGQPCVACEGTARGPKRAGGCAKNHILRVRPVRAAFPSSKPRAERIARGWRARSGSLSPTRRADSHRRLRPVRVSDFETFRILATGVVNLRGTTVSRRGEQDRQSVRAHSISRRSSWRPWYRTGHRRFVRGSSDARSAAPRRCPPCGRHVGSPAGPRRRARIPHPGKTRWRSREPDRTIARRRGVTDEVDVRGGVTNGSLFEPHVVAARDRRQGRRSP